MSGPIAGDNAGGPRSLVLSARARALLDVLSRLKGDAAARYEGVVRVMADMANPTRERMAAFGMRELLEELERLAGVATKGPSLRTRVKQLGESWDKAQRGEDGALVDAAIVAEIDQFFDEYNDDYPSRRARAKLTIVGLDPARREGPPAVRAQQITSLMDFRDDLNKILHGTGDTGGFVDVLDGLEDFLLGWLRPRPFEDYDSIDDALRKGPPRA